LPFLFFILGIALLLIGGYLLVRGASEIAEDFGVSPLVIGMTVVAFGTSAPELVINIIGVLSEESDIAFGNITGSNLANLGLVLGAAALLTPIQLQGQLIRRELPLLLLATCVLMVIVSDPLLRGTAPVLDRSDSIILLLLFGIFVYITVHDFAMLEEDPILSVAHRNPDRISEFIKNWSFVGGGVVFLLLGGQLTITNGVELAERLGVSDVVIGMIMVAVGTSLPEFVTSTIAAIRKEADLCVGNVVGSNIFNSMLVLPVSALISPIPVPSGGVTDIFVSLLLAALLIPIFIRGKSMMSRMTGLSFLVIYIAYMGFRVSSGVIA